MADEIHGRTYVPSGNTIRVGLADLAVGGPDQGLTFTTSGLGSCVAVAFYDATGVGALLHAMLPTAPDAFPTTPGVRSIESTNAVTPAKYVNTGIDAALAEIDARAGTQQIHAKLTGGSSMLDLGHDPTIGDQNVRAARETLADRDVDLVAAETGGSVGRSVRFTPSTGDLTVTGPDHTTTL